MELQPILHVWINHDNDLVDLTVASTVPGKKGQADQQTTEVIHTNQKHPFLTQEAGFVPVADLNVGMHLVEADGNVGVITGWTVVPGAMTMYNLEVAQDHTFTVGDGQWVVHNCGTTGMPDPVIKVAGQPNLYKGQQIDTDPLRSQGWNPDKKLSKIKDAFNGPFMKFLTNQGKSTSGWKYFMEEWTKQGEENIQNHYWHNMFEGTFHHH